MEIVTIKPVDTYSIRHLVLRPHQRLDDCKYSNDFEDDSFHLGCTVDNQLVGIVSFYQENHPEIPAELQFRFRGMAVIPEFRNRGIGANLYRSGLDRCKELEATHLWCNARVSAAKFYKKLGMAELGPEFDLPPIGPHYVMVAKCS